MTDRESRRWRRLRHVVLVLAVCAAWSLWAESAAAQPKRSKRNLPAMSQTVRDLVVRLYSPQPWSRWQAAFDLGAGGAGGPAWQREAGPAVPYLIEMLYDDAILRARDAPSVFNTGVGKFANVPMPDSPAEGAAYALAALGRVAVGPLAATVRQEEDEQAAKHAAWALAHIRDDGAATLMINEVRDGHPVLINSVRYAVRRLDKVLEVLTVAAGDKRATVREVAAHALAGRDSGLATKLLLEALHDTFWTVRREAAASLGVRPDDRSLEPLLESARYDPAAQVRAAALGSLGSFKDPRVVAAVGRGLYDGSAEPRAAAARTAAKLRMRTELPRILGLLRDVHPQPRTAAAQALRVMSDRRGVQRLIAQLRDVDTGARREAALTLGALRDVRAVQPLIAVLNDEVEAVRLAAVSALAAIDVPQGNAAIIKRLENKLDPAVRLASVKALGDANVYAAVEPLMGMVDDSEPAVASAASAALNRLTLSGGLDVETTVQQWTQWWQTERGEASDLVTQAGDKDTRRRIAAAQALRLNRDPRAPDLLIKLLKDPHASVRAAAAESLTYHRAPSAFDALLVVLDDSDAKAAREAALALYAIRDPRAVDRLLARALFIDEPEKKRRYIQALGTVGHADAIEPLLTIVNGDDTNLSRAAAAALMRITGHEVGYEVKDWNRWWALNRPFFTERLEPVRAKKDT